MPARRRNAQGTPGGARPGPRGSLLLRDAADSERGEAAGRRQREGSARPPRGRPRAKSGRLEEQRECRLCGAGPPCPSCPRSELTRPSRRPGPAPAARRELLAVPPGAAQARRRRAGRAELRPGTAGGARGVRGEPHLLCGAKHGFARDCAALLCPTLSSGQRRGLPVAPRGPPLRAGPLAPLRRCPGRTWRSAGEINISARPEPGEAALSRVRDKGHALCPPQQQGMVPAFGHPACPTGAAAC